jgi:AcrR family transcriptional regulator
MNELSRVGEEMPKDDLGRRQAFERAALVATGERGYRRLTVQDILDRAGHSRALFYRLYSDKSDCYASAYARGIDELAADLLAAGRRQRSWPAALRASLAAFGDYLITKPVLARGLLVEVHVARGAGLLKRAEVFEQLAEALDGARAENQGQPSPPPITAAFILNTIDAAAVRSLVGEKPRAFADAIPELVFIAVSLYFGREAAQAILDA